MKGTYMHRIINGKNYVIWFEHKKKATAKKEAEGLRRKGYNVRVLPIKRTQWGSKGYATYRTDRRQ